jgi:hypothetical protein
MGTSVPRRFEMSERLDQSRDHSSGSDSSEGSSACQGRFSTKAKKPRGPVNTRKRSHVRLALPNDDGRQAETAFLLAFSIG